MSWKIRYNGFGHSVDGVPASDDWGTLDIDDYRVEPIWDTGEHSVIAKRHTISGTALIKRATAEAFASAVGDAREKLVAANDDLLVTIIDSGSNSRTIVDIDPTDDNKKPETTGYPRGEFTINEFYGELAALVSFTIAWETVPFPESPTSDALTHTWSQRFSIDDTGATTWTVNGELRIATNATLDSSSQQNQGPNADAYRELICPQAPTGFRVETQEYAVNEDNSRLIYSVQMREYGRELPDPARRGTGSFEYERALATSSLGTKVFDATLYGDPGTDRGALLATLVKVSKARIRYAGNNADLIDSIRVTEDEIFENNVISYRVVARSMNADALTTSLTRPLVGGLTSTIPSSKVRPYGHAGIRAVKRAIFEPGDEITAASVEDEESAGSEQVYEIQEESSDGSFVNEVPDGVHNNDITDDALRFPYSVLTSTITVEDNTRMTVLTPAKADAAEIPFQIGKPAITVTERIEIARQNAAPPAVFLKAVPGSIIEYERHSPGVGKMDGNGNRTFTLAYERRYRLLDSGTSERGHFTQSVAVPGFGSVDFRAWNPNNNIVRMPFDPRTEAYTSAATSLPFTQHPKGPTFTYTIDQSGVVAAE